MKRFQLLALSVMLSLAWCSDAQAGPWGWSVGVRVGGPYCYPGYYRPWYPGWGVYVRPYPVYYGAGPVVYEPAPLVVQPAPVVVQPVPSTSAPVLGVTPAVAAGDRPNSNPTVDYHLQILRSGEEAARQSAAIELGRTKSE